MDAAMKGNMRYQYRLGMMYLEGNKPYIPKDAKMAFFWLSRSAAKGHQGAMMSLAECYLNGEGVKKDEKEGQRLSNLFHIKEHLRDILTDNREDVEAIMETIFQFTGYVK